MIKTNKKELSYLIIILSLISIPFLSYYYFIAFAFIVVLLGGWFEILLLSIMYNAFIYNNSPNSLDQFIIFIPVLLAIILYQKFKYDF